MFVFHNNLKKLIYLVQTIMLVFIWVMLNGYMNLGENIFFLFESLFLSVSDIPILKISYLLYFWYFLLLPQMLTFISSYFLKCTYYRNFYSAIFKLLFIITLDQLLDFLVK